MNTEDATMNHCKTCKHWVKYQQTILDDDGSARLKAGGGMCGSEKLTENWGEHGSDMLVYSYAEGGGFWTGPNFGCVHHQE